ncbi:hypothetical protein ACN28S_03550 [Cystobacter fuscus]
MTSGEDTPLTRVLLAHAPEDRRDWLREWPGLEALLAGHLAAGEGAGPR